EIADMSAVDDLRRRVIEPPIVDDALTRTGAHRQVDLDRLRRRQLVRQNADESLKAHAAKHDLVLGHRLHAASIARRISRAKVTALATLSAAARTIALPMTTPSARRATWVAWSARETPKPTQIGNVVA